MHASQVRAQRKVDTMGPTEGSAEEARKRESDDMAIALPQESTCTVHAHAHAHSVHMHTRDAHTRAHTCTPHLAGCPGSSCLHGCFRPR